MKMLKAKQVAERIGFSTSELYRKIAAGAFPKGKKMCGSTRWADYIVDAWNILFWGLNEPLPNMAEETLREVEGCIATARRELSA